MCGGVQMEGGDGEVASLEAMLIESKMKNAEDALTIMEVPRLAPASYPSRRLPYHACRAGRGPLQRRARRTPSRG